MDINNQVFTAVFEISGFEAGLNDTEAFKFEMPQNMAAKRPISSIKSITFSNKVVSEKSGMQKSVIWSASVIYQEGIEVDEYLLSVTKRFLEKFVLMFLIEKEINPKRIRIILTSYTGMEKGSINIHFFENMSIKEELQIFRLYEEEKYRKVLEDEMLNDSAIETDFDVLKAIFDVDNVESRYLLQYEFLKHLVADLNGKSHGSQKLVQDFIMNTYNSQVDDDYKIGITNSLNNPNEIKDNITYYRNVIGHPAVTKDEKERLKDIDLEQTLIGYSGRLSSVILFALRKK